MKRLDQLCDFISDQCDPATSGATVYVGLEHINSGTFRLIRHGAPSEVRSSKNRFRKDDVLYGKLRPYLDKAALAECGGICSTDILVLRPKPDVCPAYLLALIHSSEFLDHANSTTHGVNHPRTSWTSLLEFEWDVPLRSVQEKVATVLWKVQIALEAEEQLITSARELKEAAMRQLFTRGLRGDPQKETEIGLLPSSWNVAALGTLGRIGNGSTPLKGNPAYWANGTLPWLTSAKVYDVTIQQADQFVTPKALEECHLPRVQPGSVLVAITGQGKTLGHAAVTAIETCVSQHIAYIQFNTDGIVPHFVRLFLESRYDQLRAIAQGGGSTKGALTCGFLKTFLIPQPRHDEQEEIAAALLTIERNIAVHKCKLATMQELFRTMLHQLMTGHIPVATLDIDVSDVRS